MEEQNNPIKQNTQTEQNNSWTEQKLPQLPIAEESSSNKLTLFLIIVLVILLGIGGYFFFLQNNNKSTTLGASFSQNYNEEDFITYDEAEYYSIKYPKGWVVYQVRGQDTVADSLLLLPKDIADRNIEASPGTMLSSREAYEIKYSSEEGIQQMIEIGASFQYSDYIPPEKHEESLKLYAASIEESGERFNEEVEAQVVNFNGIPRVHITTKDSVSIFWFAKADPQGREVDVSPVFISVTYTTSPENFSEEIFNGVVNSVEEDIWEVFFNARPGITTNEGTESTSSADSGQLVKERDARRITDIKQLQFALESYFDANSKYPTILSVLAPSFIVEVPTDPLDETSYFYTTDSNGSTYHVGANVEQQNYTALNYDVDKINGFNGSDTNGCNNENDRYCYDESPF